MSKRARARNLGKKLLDATTLRERIELRAYELFELRERGDGFDLQDWLQAEQEVLDQLEPSDEFTK
jgi:DUF2934 family protein